MSGKIAYNKLTKNYVNLKTAKAKCIFNNPNNFEIINNNIINRVSGRVQTMLRNLLKRDYL